MTENHPDTAFQNQHAAPRREQTERTVAPPEPQDGRPVRCGASQKSGRFYRPGLDVLRFFAFFAVFCHHGLAEAVAGRVRVEALVQSWGFGLCLFFSLSAYLITTLLLRERAQTGSVSLPLFYRRRILRIWPLYFLGLAVGLALDWHFGLFPANRSFYLAALVLLGNLRILPSYALHLWSISVEEQFYVFWPSAVKRLRGGGLGWCAALLTAASVAITGWYGHRHVDNAAHTWFNSLVQMQMFGGGILLALWHDRRGTLLRWPWMRVAAFALTPFAWYFAVRSLGVKIGIAHGAWREALGYGLVAVTCALLVDAMASLQRASRTLIALGRISFGLYVFHIPILLVVQGRTHGRHLSLVLPFDFLLTLGAAMLSYRYLETPFLRLKAKLEVVKSRPISASPL